MSKLVKITVVIGLLLCPFAAVACDCALTPLRVRYTNSEVIMVAEITSVVPMQQVVVKPIELFKGQIAGTETISTGSSLCDYFLSPIPSVGERYLLFLSRRDGKVVANRCFMPGPLSEKRQEVEELRNLTKQNAQQSAPEGAPKAARP